MFKRLLYTFMIFIALTSIALGLYRFFEANDTVHVASDHMPFMIEYDGVKQYALSNGDSSTSYFLFCSVENDNCQYIVNTLYSSVNSELINRDINDIVEYVNIQTLIDEGTIDRLNTEWNINNYPAFISVSNNYGELTINNSLVWDDANPLSSNDILNWLAQNGQYDGQLVEEAIMP